MAPPCRLAFYAGRHRRAIDLPARRFVRLARPNPRKQSAATSLLTFDRGRRSNARRFHSMRVSKRVLLAAPAALAIAVGAIAATNANTGADWSAKRVARLQEK